MLNDKCLRHSMNSNNPRLGTNKINKISLLRFDDEIHFLNNRFDVTAFILITIENSFLCQAIKNIILITSLVRTTFFVKL